jgi:hypothetical protein
LARVESDPGFLSSLDFIVTDYYFESDDPHNGLTLAQALREKGFVRPILLASNAEFSSGELTTDIDARVGKTFRHWDDFAVWVAAPDRAPAPTPFIPKETKTTS